MIIFLYGEDTYRSRQKLNEFVGRYKKVHKEDLGLKRLEGNGLDFKDFQDDLETISMFGGKKLFLLENIFSNQGFKDWFLKNKKRILSSNSTILIYEGGKANKKDKFFRFLLKNSRFQEFSFLGKDQLKRWAKTEFSRYDIKIQEKALSELVDFVGSDLWRMANEIRKLAAYKGKGGVIKADDVRALLKPKIDADIFKTVNAIAGRNKKIALGLLRAHLGLGDSPLYLFSMIDFQFRNLLIIKDLLERGLSLYSSGLHPYAARKTLPLLKKFTFVELKKIYRRLFELDLEIKSGRINPEIALDLLITEI